MNFELKMPKTLVKKKICEGCGADVRAGSLFCYNCGGSVTADAPKTKNSQPETPIREEAVNDRLPDEAAENADSQTANIDLKTTPLKEEAIRRIELKPIEKPLEKLPVAEPFEKIEDRTAVKPPLPENSKMKSAASLRRKAKSFQRKRVEIVWEEPENAPNKWFPIVAVFLILLVVVIFYLAMYLK